MDFSGLIEKKRARFDELESAVTSGSLYDDPAKAREILREHARLKELLSIADECRRIEQQIAENRELASDNDAEIAEMAQAELPELEQKLPELEKRLQIALLRRSPMKIAMPSWKSALARAARRPRFLPPTSIACMCASPRQTTSRSR